jgi:cyclopropane fatty-acyl-phospholipid synthase-like methyltransferase
MKPDQITLKRQKLFDCLPATGEILRGTLLERTTRSHGPGCTKCASGEGHPLWVLTVTYPGGRTKQLSLRTEQVPEVRRWLRNYQNLKEAIETICELNQELLRANREAAKARSKSRD